MTVLGALMVVFGLMSGVLPAAAQTAPPTCGGVRATIIGTPGSDRIAGTPGSDVIQALGGRDMVSGGGGYDIVCGGDGSDVINGDAGTDAIYGEAGNDTMFGGADSDGLFGGAGYDQMRGGEANDALYGEASTDVLFGENGDDTLRGQTDSDAMYGGPGADDLRGGQDEDVAYGQAGPDRLFGEVGDDQLYGGDGNDRLDGGFDNDTLSGEGGDDELYGRRDHDRLFGGANNDVLHGNEGNDRLDGGPQTGPPGDYCEGGPDTDDFLNCENDLLSPPDTPRGPVQRVAGSPPPFPLKDPASEPAAAPGAVRGGTLTVGISPPLPAPGTLNPAVNTQGTMQQVAGLLFNGLVGLDEDARPVPELATDWEIADSGRVYRFFLRPNVRWHDGAPFTAADVKFSYEAALVRYHARTQSSLAQALEQPCTQPPAAPSCPSIQATEATGGSPATVVFRFAQPYAALLQQLTHTDGAIIPRHVFTRTGTLPTPSQPWPAGQNPVTTGPYRFVSHTTTEIVFERNPDFFRPGLPLLDRVVQRAVTSPAESLRRGEVDWIWGAPGQAIPALRSDPNVRVFTGSMSAGGSTNCVLKIPINLWARGASPAQIRAGTAPPHPILADQRVRQAVAHALNRDEYVGSVLRSDGGRVANAPIHSGMPFAHAPQQFPEYSLEEARRLLREAGWTGETGTRTRGGVAFSIDTYGFAGVQTDLMNRMRQDLAAVGIDLRVNTIDAGAMNTRYANRDYDTLVFSNCQATDPEIGVRRLYHSSAITGAPFTNGAGYRNPDVDRLFEEGARGFPVDRSRTYDRAQEQIARDLPYLWLLETVTNRAWRANCEGFRPFTGHFAETAFCRR